MKYSYLKLKELAQLDSSVTLDQVVNAFNSIGFEVEQVENFQHVEGVVYAKLLKVEKNPQADNLNVCLVETKNGETIIQTAAQNVIGQEGKYVIAFVPGSKTGNVTLAAREMKGIVSNGMLASPGELVPNAELFSPEINAGILILDKVDLNSDPILDFKLNDHIIEINILSNRSDANSYQVMALELAAYFGSPSYYKNSKLELPLLAKDELEVDQKNTSALVMLKTKDDVKLSFDDVLLLIKSGVKSVNDAVDLTNLTLLMAGQPTHVYYANGIKKIGADYQSLETKIFGDKEVSLNNNLVIKNQDEAISLAGVMGFAKHAVVKKDAPYLFEFGIFDNASVRKSMLAIKLESSAGRQSAREVSFGTLKNAVQFLASKLSDFKVSEFPKYENKIIKFSEADLLKWLDTDGLKYDFSKTKKSLEHLGFEFNGDLITIPDYRHDISNSQDLVEEFLRFYGYNNIEPRLPIVRNLKVEQLPDWEERSAALGYQEVRTYSLTSIEKNTINPFDFKEDFKLLTFVSNERQVVRNSLLNSHLEVVEYNLKRNLPSVNIFELGIINNSINTLAIASTSKSFDQLLADVKNLLSNYDVEFNSKKTIDFLHPIEQLSIYSNSEFVGYIGRVKANLSDYDLVFAEWKLEGLKLKTQNDLSRFIKNPLKTIDLNFEIKVDEINTFKLHEKIEQFKNDIYDFEYIDTFIKDEIKIITVRFWSDDEGIKVLKNINQ